MGRGTGGNEGVSGPVRTVLHCHPGTELQSLCGVERARRLSSLQMVVSKATGYGLEC